jgi:molybdopterin-guanine dinucleotide biosynthesis protein B
MSTNSTPVLCFVGLSNCGKTTLTAQVIESLSMQGLKIGALKHASHGFHMDRPGKDTDRFRQAGAHAIGIASDTERAVITTTAKPTTLAELVRALPPGLDLVLCEGFASEPARKIGVHRDRSPLPAGLQGLVAVVGECPAYPDLPSFDAGDLDGISRFVLESCGLWIERRKDVL